MTKSIRSNSLIRGAIARFAWPAMVLLAFGLPAADVAAHGPDILLRSEPPAGIVLSHSPQQMILWFSTELDSRQSHLQVFDGNGRQVDNGNGGVDLSDLDHKSLMVELPELKPGVYTTRWRAAIFDDDDIVEGETTFTVENKQADMPHAKMSHKGMSLASMTMTKPTRPKKSDMATEQMSEKGQYRVRFTSKIDPIVINQMHSWVLHVETANGRTVDEAVITIDGGMPDHNHGLPTAPRVTNRMGNGDYLVEGLKFHMNGWWVVNFTITNHNTTDSVMFNLLL